jgi:hypothetical protein
VITNYTMRALGWYTGRLGKINKNNRVLSGFSCADFAKNALFARSEGSEGMSRPGAIGRRRAGGIRRRRRAAARARRRAGRGASGAHACGGPRRSGCAGRWQMRGQGAAMAGAGRRTQRWGRPPHPGATPARAASRAGRGAGRAGPRRGRHSGGGLRPAHSSTKAGGAHPACRAPPTRTSRLRRPRLWPPPASLRGPLARRARGGRPQTRGGSAAQWLSSSAGRPARPPPAGPERPRRHPTGQGAPAERRPRAGAARSGLQGRPGGAYRILNPEPDRQTGARPWLRRHRAAGVVAQW